MKTCDWCGKEAEGTAAMEPEEGVYLAPSCGRSDHGFEFVAYGDSRPLRRD